MEYFDDLLLITSNQKPGPYSRPGSCSVTWRRPLAPYNNVRLRVLQLVVPTTQKKSSKRDDRFWSLSNQGARHPRDKGSQLDTKGCRCVNLDESASEVEDKRSGSLEGSAKGQLRRVINGSVSENRRRAGCDTAANCRRFKSSFDSFVIFSGFSGRMERSTNRCCSHVGAPPPPSYYSGR